MVGHWWDSVCDMCVTVFVTMFVIVLRACALGGGTG